MTPVDMPGELWSVDDVGEALSWTQWFFEINAPWIAVAVALMLAIGIVAIIVSLMGKASNDEDDDDFEIYR